MIILITGGIKSGKSDFALKLVKNKKNVYFIASAKAEDEEMKEKIALHRKKRPKEIITIEEPLWIAKKINNLPKSSTLIIDCVNLWVTNMMKLFDEDKIIFEVKKLLNCIEKFSKVIIVTNEVGLSLVAINKLARKFQQLLGKVNQIIAQKADKVYIMISGIPVKIK